MEQHIRNSVSSGVKVICFTIEKNELKLIGNKTVVAKFRSDEENMKNMFKLLSGEVDREFSSYPQDKILLPMAPVRIRGEDWKRHIPSYYLAELICALRSGGHYNGKLGQGSPPNWFPKSGKWSWRGFHNSSSGPNERKTDICESILHTFGYDPAKHFRGADVEDQHLEQDLGAATLSSECPEDMMECAQRNVEEQQQGLGARAASSTGVCPEDVGCGNVEVDVENVDVEDLQHVEVNVENVDVAP